MYYRVELQSKEHRNMWFGVYVGRDIIAPKKGESKPSVFGWMKAPHPVKAKHKNFECWMTEKGFQTFVKEDFSNLIKAYPGKWRIRKMKRFSQGEIKFKDEYQAVRLVSERKHTLPIIHKIY